MSVQGFRRDLYIMTDRVFNFMIINPDSVLYTMTGIVCDIMTINHNSVLYTMTCAVCDIKTLNLYDDRRCL